MTKLAVLGDHFMSPELFATALREATSADLELTGTTLPWPLEPYGRIAEVDEASGDEESVIAALGDAEICLTQMAPITERVLATAPGLRLVCVARGGPVNVNLEAAHRRGVTVTAARGRNANATAEHTVALMLAAARRIPARHEELIDGQWRSDYYAYEQCGPGVFGSVVGLVGYGSVGRRVAGIVRAMGAHVLVYDPYNAPAEPDVERVDDLADLLSRADFLSLHARLTDETANLIGRREIGLLRRGCVLVNAARGGLLDYDAAGDALESGTLFGLGLDVFPEEPLPADSRLRSLPNVVMTPHLAGATRETAQLAARLCAQEVARYLGSRTSVDA
jgi:D-3-phosphoglycerate dehydrogenase